MLAKLAALCAKMIYLGGLVSLGSAAQKHRNPELCSGTAFGVFRMEPECFFNRVHPLIWNFVTVERRSPDPARTHIWSGCRVGDRHSDRSVRYAHSNRIFLFPLVILLGMKKQSPCFPDIKRCEDAII